MNHERIVFFDGVCATCNFFVDLLLKLDRSKILRYAPLQGKTARQLISQEDIENLETLVFKDEDGLWRRSEAACRISALLPWPWRIVSWMRIIPHPIRDWGYNLFARHRYQLFGKKGTCRLPSTAEKDLFLE